MKLVVFGTGVIGSIVGWQLQNNNDITHYVRPDRIPKLEAEGIRIHGIDQRNRKNQTIDVLYRPRFASSLDGITEYDACLLSVKSNQLLTILNENKHNLAKIPIVLMQNIGLHDYEAIAKTLKGNVSFAYPFLMGGGRDKNTVNCTIVNTPINQMVFGNISGKKREIEKELMKEFAACRLRPAYSRNIVAYLKLHYVWASCALASYINSGSYERFIDISEIAKSYKAMVECFRQFEKEGIHSRSVFPYYLYHLPAGLLGAFSRLIYNSKAMENMVVGHITSSPDEMKEMFDSLVSYCADNLGTMNAFNSYIESVKRYYVNNM